MPISSYAMNLLWDDVLTKSIAISLHTGDPGTTGANELPTERQRALMTKTKDDTISTSNTVEFDRLPSSTISHFGMWVNGNYFAGGRLLQARKVEEGDSFRLPVGKIVIGVRG